MSSLSLDLRGLMHSSDVPDSADGKPSVVPSETPHTAPLEKSREADPAPATAKESSEGPPKTVWGTIAFACTIISGAYCWAFTTWDKVREITSSYNWGRWRLAV
jgi:hypothetical protein